uniref:FHF complex subunit HOOK-interacting protein C-terminal domain-containing protein n=1 Tax=Trichobilharzia regenti TaxID=157069 RepID=A0AA85KGD4_TRIRE|nr:unnamed protein product [Trichobilharzia regenti]
MRRSESDLMLPSGSIQEFYDHWDCCKSIINDSNNTVLSIAKIESVFNHVGKIILLVVDEHFSCKSEQNTVLQGSYLEAVLHNNIFQSLLIWIEASPTLKDDKSLSTRDVLRRNLIIAFEQLITQSRQNVLLHRPILQPLCQLLFKLSSQLRSGYDQIYGRLLHSVCVLLCRNYQLLEFSRQLCKEIFNQPYMIFSLLVPLVHRNDTLGDSARDSFLLIFAISKKDDQLGQYLAYESDICPVLATGLSGLYSSLPKKLVPRYSVNSYNNYDYNNTSTNYAYNNNGTVFESPGGPVSVTTPVFIQSDLRYPCLLELQVGGAEWHQLTEKESNHSIDLRRFLHTLDFCNLTVKIAHPHVRDQLLHFIHSGFLIPVLGSALHQSAMDEVIAATAYLELFLRRLTEPLLIRLFLKFIIIESYDTYHILTSIMNRLNANAVLITDKRYRLGMVTLSLFRTILSFHCEDVMYELIFKHLLTLNYLDPEKHDSSNSNNNLHKTSSLTSSTLSLSNNGNNGVSGTPQPPPPPKLCWSTSPRLNSMLSTSMTRSSTVSNQHPSVSELIPHLVKSAEVFLSLANTSSTSASMLSSSNDRMSRSNHKHESTGSEKNKQQEQKKTKKTSNVSYCPIEKLRNDSKEIIFTGTIPNTDPLTDLNAQNINKEMDQATGEHSAIDSDDDTDDADHEDGDDDDDDDKYKTLNKNEWVVIRTAHPILLTDNYPELLKYIKSAHSRVSRRRQACKSWYSQYWPKTTEIINHISSMSSVGGSSSSSGMKSSSTPIKMTTDDETLELQEKQAQNDLYRTTTISGSIKSIKNDCVTQCCVKLIEEHDRCLRSDTEAEEDGDGDGGTAEGGGVSGAGVCDSSSSSIHLQSLSRQHASSMYQLNYLNDFSDEENCHDSDKNDKDTSVPPSEGLPTTGTRQLSRVASTEVFHPVQGDDNNNNEIVSLDEKLENVNEEKRGQPTNKENEKKPKRKKTKKIKKAACLVSPRISTPHSPGNSTPTCTCLSTLPDLLRLAHLDPSIQLHKHNSIGVAMDTVASSNNNDDGDDERKEYELENFLAALDCLPSPGHCPKHFGHLPPFISYSKIDNEFFVKLDEYIKEFEASQLMNTEASLMMNTSSTLTGNSNSDSTASSGVVNSKSLTQQMEEGKSSAAELSNDRLLDSVLLDRSESRQSSHKINSNSSSTCSVRGGGLTDFPSTPSLQSARHNSNSVGVAGGIGPFLSILLNRLANMHNNCFFTNLLLTDIFAALASYPCPLLYEFLLNPVGLSVKPSVNTLYKVLRSVNSQIVVASESVEQWKSLVFRARVYLNIVWPGPFKMTIDPNFYTTHRGGGVSQARDATSKSSQNHSTDCQLHKNSLQHVIPLSPVIYPTPSMDNININNSKAGSNERSHRSGSVTSSTTSSLSNIGSHIRHSSRSRINQLFGLTSRIALSPVLKRASLQQQQPRSSLFSSDHRQSKSKVYNSGSEDEGDGDADSVGDHSNRDGSHLKFPGSSDTTTDISNKTRNLVYASIIFDEFCYELASICYEHSLNPCFPNI